MPLIICSNLWPLTSAAAHGCVIAVLFPQSRAQHWTVFSHLAGSECTCTPLFIKLTPGNSEVFALLDFKMIKLFGGIKRSRFGWLALSYPVLVDAHSEAIFFFSDPVFIYLLLLWFLLQITSIWFIFPYSAVDVFLLYFQGVLKWDKVIKSLKLEQVNLIHVMALNVACIEKNISQHVCFINKKYVNSFKFLNIWISCKCSLKIDQKLEQLSVREVYFLWADLQKFVLVLSTNLFLIPSINSFNFNQFHRKQDFFSYAFFFISSKCILILESLICMRKQDRSIKEEHDWSEVQ